LVYTILINELLSLYLVDGDEVTRVKKAALPPYMIMPVLCLNEINVFTVSRNLRTLFKIMASFVRTNTAVFTDTYTEYRTDIGKYRQNTDLNNRTDPALDHTVTLSPCR
jgi:hypothetical protein